MPLHLIWLLDFSASMRADGKVGSIRFAVQEFSDAARRALAGDGSATIGRPCVVSVLVFSAGARWACESVPIDEFAWSDGWLAGTSPPTTDLGAAFRAVGQRLGGAQAPQHGPAPVLVLASDGQPTDDWVGGLCALNEVPWGRSSLRVGVRLGPDAQDAVLESFAGVGNLCEPRGLEQTVLSVLYTAAAPRDPRTHTTGRAEFFDEFPADETVSIEW